MACVQMLLSLWKLNTLDVETTLKKVCVQASLSTMDQGHHHVLSHNSCLHGSKSRSFTIFSAQLINLHVQYFFKLASPGL